MTSIATQSLIDNFTDRTGQVIELNNKLVAEHLNNNNNIKYSFYHVIDVKPDTIEYGFVFYGDENNKSIPLQTYNLNRNFLKTVQEFNEIKSQFNIYIANDLNSEWKGIFEQVKDDWELNDPQGQKFHKRSSPLLEERGPSPQQGGRREFKNYGGGGKKLTRKNRKHLMKLYRKNKTRNHRGGVGKPRTVCWDKIYWHDLNLICDEAITQLRTK